MSVRTIPSVWLSCAIASLLCACGGGESTASTTPTVQAASAPRPVTQSNSEIANLIYSDSQRTPSGFYGETVPVFSGYVATSHLKTRDINSSAVLQYELCSDDFNTALQWSETYNTNSGDNAALTGTENTDRYFQFDRLRSGSPMGYLQQRVYKCSYLSRNTVDLLASSGEAGTLNARPMDATTLKILSEYLWQFTSYNNFGNVVLKSSGDSSNTGLSHSIVIASLTRASSANSCDSIALNEWRHTANMTTGELELTLTPLLSFQAQESNGMVAVC
ncbi:MAG: hypothetical protein AB7F79_01705 [Steroidobacteraceae bacterium]